MLHAAIGSFHLLLPPRRRRWPPSGKAWRGGGGGEVFFSHAAHWFVTAAAAGAPGCVVPPLAEGEQAACGWIPRGWLDQSCLDWISLPSSRPLHGGGAARMAGSDRIWLHSVWPLHGGSACMLVAVVGTRTAGYALAIVKLLRQR